MSKTLRIAVADDEPDMLDYFRVVLPRLGYQVVAMARTGSELVNLCSREKPDLIIADVRMPELSGDAAIQQICKAMPTPYILISAFIKPAEFTEAITDVCHTYLTKPVKRSNLQEAIELVMR
jgi:CheY-like chemotaxis protein